jgi:hypothetical protein
MESQDSKGLSDALEKAYRDEWIDTPVKEFPFKDTLRDYMRLYE